MNADLGQQGHLPTTIRLPTVDDVRSRFDNLSALHAGVINAPDYVREHFHEKFPARDIAEHCGLSHL